MKLLTKLTGTWKQAKAYWFKAPVGWSLPGWLSVRRVFVKVNGQWQRTYIRNSFVVYALGLLQGQVPNAWVGVTMNARGIAGGTRSYSLVQLTKDGELKSFRSYDIFFDGNNGTTNNTISMVEDLNAMPDGQIFIVYSFDEPSAGHTHPLLVAAIERVGGVPGVYSQPMSYRGAYMLLGKVGFPAYFEKYVGALTGGTGAGDGDPNAWITKRFTIINNMVLLMNDNWNWGAAVKRDVHEVYALGHFQTVYPWATAGIWVSDTVQEPKKAISAGRSYNLTMINANNAVTASYYYDIYYDRVSGTLTNTNHLIAELNGMANGQVFVLFTHDEPSYGKDNTALIDALERVGASYDIVSAPFGYAGAYMLIGKVGSPPTFERYVGIDGDPEDDVGDPNAAIKMSFFVENNEIHLVQ